MAMGTNDQWEAATMGYQNVGPNYWKGEEGRLALIKGEPEADRRRSGSRPSPRSPSWKDYLGDGFEAQTYPDSQNLFTLGRAAIYPAGSWEIAPFEAQIQGAFEMGAFPPPVPDAGDDCYISDHVDIAIGLNAASPNADAAKAFLEWVGTPEFAQLYANALPGFFPLQTAPVTLEDPLSQEFVSWREKCASTIRSTYQILSRGTPNLENETWNASANVIRGTETPEAAAAAAPGGPRHLVRAAEELTHAAAPPRPTAGGAPFPSVRNFLTLTQASRSRPDDPEPHHQQGADDDPGPGPQGARAKEGDLVTYRIEEGRVVMTRAEPRRGPLRDLHRVGQPRRPGRLCQPLTLGLAPGTAVRVPFPHTDAETRQRRPALVIATTGPEDGAASCSGCS